MLSLYIGCVKILNLLPRLPLPAVDGGAIAVHQLHQSLLSKNVELIVVSFLSNRHPQDEDQVRKSIPTYSCRVQWGDFTPIDAIKSIFHQKPYNVARRFAQQEMMGVLRSVKETHPRFDLIQVDWVHMTYYVDVLRELWPDSSIVLRSHNVEYIILSRLSREVKNPILSWFYRDQANKMKQFETDILPNLDGLITLTKQDLAHYTALGSLKHKKVIPVGIHPSDYWNEETKKHEGFLILGSMGWAPYAESVLSFIIDVWIDFWKRNPSETLHIVGNHPTEALRQYHQQYGITIHGFVEDIQPFLHHSKAMLIPLKSGSGMRIKVLEAVASRCPIISTDVGVEGFPFTHLKESYLANSKQEWMLALEEVSSANPKDLNALSDRAYRATFPLYDSESIAEKLLAFYHEVL